MSEPTASRGLAPTPVVKEADSPPKILYLGGTHDDSTDLQRRLGSGVELVKVDTPVRALALLARGEYVGVYADVQHFSDAVDVGRLVQNERILQEMPF